MLSDVALGLSCLLGVVLLVSIIGYFVTPKKKTHVRYKVDRMYYDGADIPQYVTIPKERVVPPLNEVNRIIAEHDDYKPFVDKDGQIWFLVNDRYVIRDCKEVADV